MTTITQLKYYWLSTIILVLYSDSQLSCFNCRNRRRRSLRSWLINKSRTFRLTQHYFIFTATISIYRKNLFYIVEELTIAQFNRLNQFIKRLSLFDKLARKKSFISISFYLTSNFSFSSRSFLQVKSSLVLNVV